MPKVGTKRFSYSSKGIAFAKKESAKTNMPMKMSSDIKRKMIMKQAMKKMK